MIDNSKPTPLHSVLIANRGEIASRIIRTCHKMGIRSIAIFSDADKDAPFVKEATTAVYIGESSPSQSYLDMDKIFEAARKTNAAAIHPGYGFFSERADFAERCQQEGVIFIGPSPNAIASMGSKSKAKSIMDKHGVPTVPGYSGVDQSDATLIAQAKKIGFPVLLKAAAGGGGKGMRIVEKSDEVQKAIAAAKRESQSAFGDDELIVEKYISSGRHIEFQIFGDQHGNVVHLLERECTIQRRYQKIIEESPSPELDEKSRKEIGMAAVKAAQAIHYDNAGTVEFIYDDQTKEFYFLEVNTRLQVEHPVTEAITGLDLVQLQIEIASGKLLPFSQNDISGNGYAVEARLYAEDPSNDFLPVTGTIWKFEHPEVDGLRIESAVQSGSQISIFYDPMIAKIIIHDEDRDSAHRKMIFVLENMVCLGTTTNQQFLIQLFKNADFSNGKYNTHFVPQNLKKLLGKPNPENYQYAAIASTIYGWLQRENNRNILSAMPSGWRNNFYQYQEQQFVIKNKDCKVAYRFRQDKFEILIEEQEFDAKIITSDDALTLEIDGIRYQFNVAVNSNTYFVHCPLFGSVELLRKERFPIKEAVKIKGGYQAPMPSQIIKVMVEEGQKVSAGDSLIILSSMKMENTIEANEAGVIEEIYVSEGQNIEAGFMMIKIESN